MADLMTGMKRTHYCGEVSAADAGHEVVVGGFTNRARDKGELVFIDLRDRTGIVQLVFDDTTDRSVMSKAKEARSEYVLMARGTVRMREAPNPELPTGDVEIYVTELRILAKAQTPPFHITDETDTNEELRLRYRYLDLRRRKLQQNLIKRAKITAVAHEFFANEGFIEIDTPMMIKSTPEGARDYVVPSRVHKGSFYALPQSPQMYKQLLMIAGFDKYVQFARCFRDEDLRADRQPEFTQIDLEMSFVDMEDILAMGERFVHFLMEKAMGVEIPTPLPRLTYQESMERYGTDKPDIRYGMEIQDISDLVKDSSFGVFRRCRRKRRFGPRHHPQRRRRHLHPQGDRQADRTGEGHRRQRPRLCPLGGREAQLLVCEVLLGRGALRHPRPPRLREGGRLADRRR